MLVGVVLVADTRVPAVEASLEALVAAVGHAESAGHTVETVVVDSSGRHEVAAFLRLVEGAEVVRAPGARRAAALLLGLDRARGEVVFSAGTEGCPVPTAVTVLAEAAARDGGVAVAAPGDPAPHAAAPAALLRRLWGDAATGGPEEPDSVPDLVRRARAGGIPVTACADAGSLSEHVRRPFGGVPGVVAGPGTYAGARTVVQTFTPHDLVELGGYCSIADDVRIVLPGGRLQDEQGTDLRLDLRGLHRPETASTFPIGILVPDEPYDQAPPGATGERLVVGDDVWIGYGATLLGDVTVGTGAVVGARALVTADVAPYTVVGGVPARVIRKRFEDDVAARLLRVAWWDWPQVAVEGAHRWFGRPVAEFLDHFDPASA
ncbi:CatB-related O-acetyltransferase [Geodermatophilus sp. SYSU D00684]